MNSRQRRARRRADARVVRAFEKVADAFATYGREMRKLVIDCMPSDSRIEVGVSAGKYNVRPFKGEAEG